MQRCKGKNAERKAQKINDMNNTLRSTKKPRASNETSWVLLVLSKRHPPPGALSLRSRIRITAFYSAGIRQKTVAIIKVALQKRHVRWRRARRIRELRESRYARGQRVRCHVAVTGHVIEGAGMQSGLRRLLQGTCGVVVVYEREVL